MDKQRVKSVLLSCGSILRFGLVFAIILYGQQTRGFIFGIITGHISVATLDGTYIGISLVNLLGNLPILGLTSAIDVLGMQAVANTSSRKQAGLIVQRTMLISIVMSFPIIAFLLLLRPVLQYIHQDNEVLLATSQFLRLSIMIIPVNALSLCMAKYLFVLGKMRAVMYSVMVTIAIALALMTAAAFSMHATLPGLHLCYLFTELLQPTLLLLYFLHTKAHIHTWSGFSLNALRDWTEVLITGLPSCGLIILEWGMYEIMLLITGVKGQEVTRVNAIGFTGVCITYMVHYGIGVATTVNISRAIASGQERLVRRYIICGLSLAIALSVVMGGLVLLFKELFAIIFHSTHLEQMTPWLLCYIVLDAYQVVMNAVLRGCNRYILPMIITVLSFAVSISLGAMLFYRPQLLVSSIWIGLCVGSLLCCVALTILLYFTPVSMDHNIAVYSIYRVEDRDTDRDEVELVSRDLTPVSRDLTPDTRDTRDIEPDDLKLLPAPVSSDQLQHIILTKGVLFLVGFTLVIVASLLNLTDPTFQ